MAETITIITTDKNVPNEEKKVEITETVTETRPKFEGTVNDIISDIVRLDSQISALETERTRLVDLKAQIETELLKK